MSRKYTEAQARAAQKYQQEHTATITIRVLKSDKEKYLNAAQKEGKSMSRFLIDCAEEHIKNKPAEE